MLEEKYNQGNPVNPANQGQKEKPPPQHCCVGGLSEAFPSLMCLLPLCPPQEITAPDYDPEYE